MIPVMHSTRDMRVPHPVCSECGACDVCGLPHERECRLARRARAEAGPKTPANGGSGKRNNHHRLTARASFLSAAVLTGLSLVISSCTGGFSLGRPAPWTDPAPPTPPPPTTTTTTTTMPAPPPIVCGPGCVPVEGGGCLCPPTPTPSRCPPEAPPLAELKISVVKLAKAVGDATPRVADRAWCAAQGRPNQDRCPFWQDDSEIRLACEAERALPLAWTLNGVDCTSPDRGCWPHPQPTKVFVALASRGTLRACAPGGIVCGEAELP
jgi:hypothetical protein